MKGVRMLRSILSLLLISNSVIASNDILALLNSKELKAAGIVFNYKKDRFEGPSKKQINVDSAEVKGIENQEIRNSLISSLEVQNSLKKTRDIACGKGFDSFVDFFNPSDNNLEQGLKDALICEMIVDSNSQVSDSVIDEYKEAFVDTLTNSTKRLDKVFNEQTYIDQTSRQGAEQNFISALQKKTEKIDRLKRIIITAKPINSEINEDEKNHFIKNLKDRVSKQYSLDKKIDYKKLSDESKIYIKDVIKKGKVIINDIDQHQERWISRLEDKLSAELNSNLETIKNAGSKFVLMNNKPDGNCVYYTAGFKNREDCVKYLINHRLHHSVRNYIKIILRDVILGGSEDETEARSRLTDVLSRTCKNKKKFTSLTTYIRNIKNRSKYDESQIDELWDKFEDIIFSSKELELLLSTIILDGRWGKFHLLVAVREADGYGYGTWSTLSEQQALRSRKALYVESIKAPDFRAPLEPLVPKVANYPNKKDGSILYATRIRDDDIHSTAVVPLNDWRMMIIRRLHENEYSLAKNQESYEKYVIKWFGSIGKELITNQKKST